MSLKVYFSNGGVDDSLILGPRRSTLQAMLVNLDNEDDLPALQSGSQSPPRINSGNLNDMDETGASEMSCLSSCCLAELSN